MAKLVSLVIDGRPVQAPEGTLVVDAAKMAGIYIPVFCYHPKMEPVGMCRMCLVEVGRPVRNRETGEFERDETGNYKQQFGPKLETACTIPVSEGMDVRGFTEKVKAGRKDIIEFLLTSHPLDCPVCDKGGECPLQNLTMDFGPGKSRFIYDEKKKLAKHFPLGELIVLDQERCIQCARCIRFQDDIVDDPVIGFSQRGRSLQIVSYSEPGFDSYFSGNTTDICPVGALVTTDFRFAARPWEMRASASICQQCPVGCNLTLNTRREHLAGGEHVVKRVMPRQNEMVNEIWICDKGRFAYHYSQDKTRLNQPMVRKNGQLEPASWDEAYEVIQERFRTAGSNLLTVAGERLANEDYYNLRKLTEKIGGKTALNTYMAGGDVTAQVGMTPDSNLGHVGPETTIVVVASDMQEEAPIYFLRVKQAAERGARLIVVNGRATKLERYASQVIRYEYGSEAATVLSMVNALSAKRPDVQETSNRALRDAIGEAAKVVGASQNVIVFFGSEGQGLEQSKALAQACANLLIATGHVGTPNNGLIGVWPRNNSQGAWDMGFRPAGDLRAAMESAKALYIVGSDPVGENAGLASAVEAAGFVVVQELFLTETAKLADVLLPAQSFVEREGTYTNGERRVQRFYPGVQVRIQARADFGIAAQIGERFGLALEGVAASLVMKHIASEVADYAGLTYAKIAEVLPQWPDVGRSELYFGGTTYENTQGLGVQLQPGAVRGAATLGWIKPLEAPAVEAGSLLAVPINRLYDRGTLVLPTELLHLRIPEPFVALNASDAAGLGIVDKGMARLALNGSEYLVRVSVHADLPVGVVLAPRSFGMPVDGPVAVKVAAAEAVPA